MPQAALSSPWVGNARALAPGVLACAVVGAAAAFLSEHYGAPVMLFALLLGMAMNFLSGAGTVPPGHRFHRAPGAAHRHRAAGTAHHAGAGGRAGLGAGGAGGGLRRADHRVSMVAARLLGFQGLFGLLTGGATAICGASAALALAAALPAHPMKDRATLFTVIGVSALSTLAMVAYPMLARALGLDDRLAGIFLGATIHDVAQVVGAGYSLSNEAGDVATLVKLMRVAMLLPVIVFAVMLTRSRSDAAGGQRPPLLPWFAVAFAVLVAINSTGWVPHARAGRGQRDLALVPDRLDRRHRHEDASEGTGRRSASSRWR